MCSTRPRNCKRPSITPRLEKQKTMKWLLFSTRLVVAQNLSSRDTFLVLGDNICICYIISIIICLLSFRFRHIARRNNLTYTFSFGFGKMLFSLCVQLVCYFICLAVSVLHFYEIIFFCIFVFCVDSSALCI